MYLSPVYHKSMWAMVYHTQPDSEEVELVTNKFFRTKKKALKWFERKRKPEHFIQPEVVRVYGFHHLELDNERMLHEPKSTHTLGNLIQAKLKTVFEQKTNVSSSLDDEESFGLRAQK